VEAGKNWNRSAAPIDLAGLQERLLVSYHFLDVHGTKADDRETEEWQSTNGPA
jgi:hypothetical protein